MKRSDMVTVLSEKLKKQAHMYRGYAKGSLSLKCLCDNLALRVLSEIERNGMYPPPKGIVANFTKFGCKWEKEDSDR